MPSGPIWIATGSIWGNCMGGRGSPPPRLREAAATSPRAGPAVPPRVGGGHANPVLQHADRLDAAGALEVGDHLHLMAALAQAGDGRLADAALDRQHVAAGMGVVGLLPGLGGGP